MATNVFAFPQGHDDQNSVTVTANRMGAEPIQNYVTDEQLYYMRRRLCFQSHAVNRI